MFLAAPDIWPLDEERQDAELPRALAFARGRSPAGSSGSAAIKLGRYWSPWPNAGVPLAAGGPGVRRFTVPLFVLIAVGAMERRRDLRAGPAGPAPLLYFSALHMVFASSMRYRIPAEMPALGLAAAGFTRIQRGRQQEQSVVRDGQKPVPSAPGEGQEGNTVRR